MSLQLPEGFEPLPTPGPFPRHIGPFFVRGLDKPSPAVGAWIGPDHVNSEGVAHGGYLLAFADFALSMMVKGVTLNLSTDFLRPVPGGTWLEAQVNERRRSRNLIFADAIARCDGHDALRISGLFKPVGGTK
jgi:acyl-coenzyme A thioesterase PaaI-like protein